MKLCIQTVGPYIRDDDCTDCCSDCTACCIVDLMLPHSQLGSVRAILVSLVLL